MKYRHYKGNIYYKLGEGKFVDYGDTLLMDNHLLTAATYEGTGENVLVFDLFGKIWVSFADRETEEALMEEEVVIYQSESTGIHYVRLKSEFEGMTEEGEERFKKIEENGRTF
jgi:hypothetical protein